MIEQKLKEFEERKLCGKNASIKRVAPHFIEKARHNLLFCAATSGLSNKQDTKKSFEMT